MAERSWLQHVAAELGIAAGKAGTNDVDALCRRVIELARSWDAGEDHHADRSGG